MGERRSEPISDRQNRQITTPYDFFFLFSHSLSFTLCYLFSICNSVFIRNKSFHQTGTCGKSFVTFLFSLSSLFVSLPGALSSQSTTMYSTGTQDYYVALRTFVRMNCACRAVTDAGFVTPHSVLCPPYGLRLRRKRRIRKKKPH
mgnify:CR=1 FL=1